MPPQKSYYVKPIRRTMAACALALLASSWVGCGNVSREESEAESAVVEFLDAFQHPQWTGDSAAANLQSAYDLLHPDTKAETTLDQFNRKQVQWIREKWQAAVVNPDSTQDASTSVSGWIVETAVEGLDIEGEHAEAAVQIGFGLPDPRFAPIVCGEATLRIELKRDGSRWRVASLTEM